MLKIEEDSPTNEQFLLDALSVTGIRKGVSDLMKELMSEWKPSVDSTAIDTSKLPELICKAVQGVTTAPLKLSQKA